MLATFNRQVIGVNKNDNFNNMVKNKTNTIVTEPVSWSNDKPLMYQSRLQYVVDENRSITISGYPARSMDASLEELKKELGLWNDAISVFNSIINDNK